MPLPLQKSPRSGEKSPRSPKHGKLDLSEDVDRNMRYQLEKVNNGDSQLLPLEDLDVLMESAA